MVKRRIALISLLALCMVLVLSAMPMSIFAAEQTATELVGTKLTTSHAGQTLSGEYYVEPGATLTLRGGTGVSGLKVGANKTLTIYIPADSVLYVYGGAASGTTGAGAGIEVNAGSTLKIIGEGKVYAYGGKAANGSSGATGDAASWGDDDYTYIPDSGYGGAGGGGAGAGIGTKGGAGGSATGWRLGFNGGRSVWTDNFKNRNISGPTGHNGNSGSSASTCGKIYISADIVYSATGGAAGTSGGSGGGRGASDYESDDHWMRGLAGGSGGGGGGAGKAGAAVGTGGGGGGGGGSGGASGYAWSYRFLGGGGGGGGAGAVGGSGGAWGADGEISGCKEYWLYGGVERYSGSGASGGTSTGGNGGQGAKIKITDWSESYWEYPYGGQGGKGGSAGNDCSAATVQKLYDVTIDVNGEVIGTYLASATEFLPEIIEIPVKSGYSFEGFYAGDVAYYDADGARTAAQITADTILSAQFKAHSYNLNINPSDGSSGDNSGLNGAVSYDDGITLATPSREGYLFRGWKISASNGSISDTAYYTYTATGSVARRSSAADEVSESFIRSKGAAMTAGFEKIGNSVTLYNLSADEDADITIEEIWVKDSFTVTFENFDGTIIDTQNGKYGDALTMPMLPDNQNEYYTYTFKYWKCNINNAYYTSEELPFLGAFLGYESELGETVYNGVTFTAVYEITEYKKELHLEGSLGNSNLNSDGKLVLNSDDTNVDVITNFKITKNDGVAVLLLIPQYDSSAFSIKAISINGRLVYGSDAISQSVLNGFDVTVTGNQTASDPLKILLDNLTPDASTSDEIFIQVVYVMNTAIGGEYEFGFVTKTPTNTDDITHGDRSEAYGTYNPDANSEADAYGFNELKITVDSTAIKVVIRATGEITIASNQSFVYNGQMMSAADISEMIANVLQYTYNGFAKKEVNTLTIKWYDAQGNELDAAPTNVGTYQIGISAAESTYYTPVAEVKATFTITPYEIYVSVGDQSVEYTGNDAVINSSSTGSALYVKDAAGNLIPVDAFVNAELLLSGVVLVDGEYVDAGTYADKIQGIVECIGNGALGNYKIVYQNGTLTITKAHNDWVTAPSDKTVEYSGNASGIDNVVADFGEVKIEYLVGYENTANGEIVPIWSETPPTNAGTYTVRVTVTGNDNYSDLACEVTLVITKKVINGDDFTFGSIDKIYNGQAQIWTTLEYGSNGEIETDEEIWIIASGSNAELLQYIRFAGLIYPADCINAGTYALKAVLSISDSNYTFILDGQEVDTWTCDNVEVTIQKRQVTVTVEDQEAIYSGSEPVVGQGAGYVTITIEDGTTPDYVTLDFFGGYIYTFAGSEFDANATYYKRLEDGTYQALALTADEFANNTNLENPVQYYVLVSTDPSEILTLIKDDGVNAGQYVLSAVLETINGNYEIVTLNSAVFTIKQQLVPVPSLGILIYNGETQLPAVPAGYENVYQFVGGGKDVGIYMLTAVLLDKENYAWENVVSLNVASLPTNKSFTVQIEDRQLILGISDIAAYQTINFVLSAGMYPYTTIDTTTEDLVLPWYIDQKTLVLVFPDATESYVYGTFSMDIINALGEPTWKDGVAPYASDSQTEIYRLNYNYGTLAYPVVGTHYVVLSQGLFNTNYNVLVEGGRVEITEKILTEDEVKSEISTVIKYYTEQELALDVNSDFIIKLLDYNYDSPSNARYVFYVTTVNTNGHINANGWMNNDAFKYYVDEERGKIYVTVTVALNDLVKANYKFADDVESFTFDVEAYIAKAWNSWTYGPEVNSTDIQNVVTRANALFGTLNEVLYFADEACTIRVSADNLSANTTYYAKFTVTGNNNYYGLETVIIFSGKHVTIIKPIVRLDHATGDVASAGGQVSIIYDGVAHGFYVPAGNGYVVSFYTAGEWKNAATYTAIVSLTDTNYAWNDGTQTDLVYTLLINKKNATITADNQTITFGDAAPTYTVGASGLVAGETIEGLLGQSLASYLSCTYRQGDNVGRYVISLQETLKDALVNYQVTLANGTLTVNKLVFDYGDVTTPDGSTFEELINNGLSFIYDSVSKEITIDNLPDELEITIVYKDAEGNVLTGKPTDAGEYTVEVTARVKSGYDVGNYMIPAASEILLTIERARITITVGDQAYDYDGNDHSGEIPTGTYTITVNNGQNLTGGVTLTISGEYVDAGVYANKISATHTYNTDNYIVTIVNGTLTINKVNNVWEEELNVDDDIVYGQGDLELGTDFFSDPKFGDSDVTYVFYEWINGGWVRLDEIPENAGEYSVIASVPGTNNYNALASSRVAFRIKQATVTLDDIDFEDATVIYNGQAHSIVVTPSALSELFSIIYNGNGCVNAGTYTVTATFALADARNYLLEGTDTLSAELVIQTVKVTITANDNSSMYGEAINALTYGMTFEGAAGYNSFYATDIGSVVLTTNATSQSNVGAYNILINYTTNANYEVAVNNGTYTITKFTGNEIVDLTASDVNYLMNLIYSATALRGEGTIVFTFAASEDGPYTSTLPKNAGTYYVKATVAETDNYDGAVAITSFEIERATLCAITDIHYNADTATWAAVVTTKDGYVVDCDVTYLVGDNVLIVPSFKATSAGNFSVIAAAVDTANYNNSAAVALATVYSVGFADKFENHNKQSNLADLTDAAYATQYRFEGQAVTRPDQTPVIVGYTFRAWQLEDVDYSFAAGVYDNITLYAAWTINTYTLNFYNEVVTGSAIVNGVFVEGTISTEFWSTYTVTYGSPFNLTGVNRPTKAEDAVYTYVFEYWSNTLRGNELDSTIYVYDNIDIYAVYASVAREFTVTYMVSIDGGAYMQHEVVTLPYGSNLVSLGNVAWFVGDTWYTDSARKISAPGFVPAEDMTLYGAYVFDIGAGDVNADGTIDTKDIINYRRWIVGGYNVITVEAGTEWSLVTSHDYDSTKTYYLVRVSDANRDDSGDIRDITTIRMALTGGYGYMIETNVGVTGDAVNLVLNTIPGITTPEELQAAIGTLTGDVRIKLTEDVALASTLILDSGNKVTINLNGHTLTLPATDNYGVAVKNGTLVIEGEGNVIVPGYYGFATSSVTNTGHIVINGGTFVGANAYYLFGCYNGSITINGGDFTALYCVLNNYPSDDYNNVMSGVATVNGGSFEVTDTDTYYRPFIFLGDVEVAGSAEYRVRTAENLAIAFQNGGTVTLMGDIVIDEDALGVYIPYYIGVDAMIIPAGKIVELDLNGYTISHEAECTESYVMINNKGSLTINDSVGTGKISFNDTGAGDPTPDTVKWASYTIRNEGTLVVNGGTIEHVGQQTNNGNNAIFSYSGSTTINGGTILAPYTRSVRLWNGSLTINGGEFDGQVWVQPASDCALTITGGSFKPATNGNDGSSVFVTNSAKTVTLSVTGGTFQTKIGCSNAEQLAGAITGGVFTESAKDNTNAALFNDGCEFVANADGTYTLIERELQ